VTVKVVSSIKAFNSTMMRAVEVASYQCSYQPYILTLHGFWRDEHVKQVGRAKWLDGVKTWEFLTGDRYGYRKFITLVYVVGREVRKEYAALIYGVGKRSRSSATKGGK